MGRRPLPGRAQGGSKVGIFVVALITGVLIAVAVVLVATRKKRGKAPTPVTTEEIAPPAGTAETPPPTGTTEAAVTPPSPAGTTEAAVTPPPPAGTTETVVTRKAVPPPPPDFGGLNREGSPDVPKTDPSLSESFFEKLRRESEERRKQGEAAPTE